MLIGLGLLALLAALALCGPEVAALIVFGIAGAIVVSTHG